MLLLLSWSVCLVSVVMAKEHSVLAEGIADMGTMECKIGVLLEMDEFKMDTMEIA